MKKMKTAFGCVLALIGVGVLTAACSANTEDVNVRPESSTLDPSRKGGGHEVQLNLSHIECLEDGSVNAHFVLLFFGSTNPGGLTGTYLDADGVEHSFADAVADKNTGNVWHYNVSLPSGFIDITSAVAGGTSLHNPDAYAGNYECGTTHEVCSVEVASQPTYCTDKPLGNEGKECGAFGLDVLAKISQPEQGSWGTCFNAPSGAYLAIVKTGSGACGSGDASYAIYANVGEGQSLCTPEYVGENAELTRQQISHITFCSCPADKIVTQ
jgi:hypothetical protein